MTGSLLQLVAKGVDDIFIIGDPEITFFKTVYRRHTNFSKGELDIPFQTKLGLGREAKCKIQRWGDLLHRLFLVINIPEIDLVFITLTIGEVKQLLLTYEIEWLTDRPGDDPFGQSEFDEVIILIDQKTEELIESITISTEVLKLFEPGNELHYNTFFAEGNTNDDVDKYYEKVISRLFEFDQFNIQYKFIVSHDTDRQPGIPLANSLVLQQILFNEFLFYTTGASTFDPASFNDENLTFFYNTETANYNIGGSANLLDSNTVFRGGISNAYGTEVFDNLDAFKIFDVTLDNNVSIISSSFDVQQIKSLLLDNIRFGLAKNPKLQLRIYDSLADDAKFIFYRFMQRLSAGNYDPNSGDFVNLSTVASNEPEFNDNFTEDFILPPETGEPVTVDHPFSNIVTTSVNTFHTTNKELFREESYINYFNDVALWGRLDVGEIGSNISEACEVIAKEVGDGQIPLSFFNMYHLNFMPYLTNKDIVVGINNYLLNLENRGDQVVGSFRQALIDDLTDMKNASQVALDNAGLCIENDFVTIDKLSNNFRRVTGPDGDIMFSSVIRLNGYIQYNGEKMLYPDYIMNRYIESLNNFSATSYDDYKDSLLSIVNLFRTPLNELPTHTSYVNLDHNQKSDLKINPRNANIILTDAISSIWYHIITEFVNDYNKLYNNTILGKTFYEENIGAELKKYLDEISNLYFNSPITPPEQTPVPIDYYRDTDQLLLPINDGAIGVYFIDDENMMGKIDIFNDQLQKYDNNRLLLNMKDIIVPKPTYYFERFNLVLNFITIDKIEQNIDNFGNLIYNHEFHGQGISDPVLDVRESIINPKHPRYDPTEPKNNAMDIIVFEGIEYEKLISEPINPFSEIDDPNKFALWEVLWLPDQSFDTSDEREKHLFLFGGVTAEELYKNVTLIDTKYNGFVNETDIYQYCKDVTIQKSSLNNLFDIKGINVIDTYDQIIKIIEDEKQKNEILLLRLNGTDVLPGLKDQLERTLRAGEPSKFAWIEYLGHYIIKTISIKINDQIIDTQTGEWLQLLHQLKKVDKKERGYNKLIGNVPELTEYTEDIKRKYQLKIPLQFWFNKIISNSLPLVALPHSDIEIIVKLRDFDELSYFEPFTKLNKKVNISGHFIAEYIYVENDERDRLSKNKHEYLIDQVQYNGEIIVNNDNIGLENVISERLFFENPCIELIWTLQRTDFINGAQLDNQRKYHNYGFNFDDGTINPGASAKIEFSSRDRENYKDIIFYDKIYPYSRHNATPSDGINCYAFSLRPELPVPNGSANLSKLDDVILNIKLKQQIIDDMIKNKTKYRWGIYALSHNILRIFSGMAGIAFYK